MPTAYKHTFEIRWADLDPNAHMRHSAYLDYGAQLRIAYFSEYGYPIDRMQRENLGPLLFTEKASYLREIRPNELITVDLALTGLSENRKHWGIRHQIFKSSGELAGNIDCRGAWLDLLKRKVIVMPDALYQLMRGMPRSDDYMTILPRS